MGTIKILGPKRTIVRFFELIQKARSLYLIQPRATGTHS